MNLSRYLLAAAICMGAAHCSVDKTAPAAGVPLSLAQQRKAQLSQPVYSLRFQVPADKKQPVAAEAQISFNLLSDSADLALDFKQAAGSVKKVMLNEQEIPVRHENEHILLPQNKLVKGPNKVAIVFEAGDAALNRNNDYMYALFVPDKARTAFPCFDQPDMKAVYALTLDLPGDWQAMSNGPVLQSTPQDSFTRWQFAPSDTISTYLFSFAAGKFRSETRMAGGREMQFLYRETDSSKLAASMSAIFDIHVQSLAFLEKYTGVPFPFKKFSFAAIPDFQFGGMEHPGAIWYNASSLFLDGSATRSQLIGRANLIAHETAHMWFGDLVTMQWFNDVWMKEVFANFMADKIVPLVLTNELADLKFMTDHFPAAYSVDRTAGANPIRQPLDNLNEAGSLYGAIIYHKAPIMMQQLERLIGAQALQAGLGTYLKKYAFSNASWPDLITILDEPAAQDLVAWNDSWVNKAGRPGYNEPLTDPKGNTYGLFPVDTGTLSSIPSIKDPVLRAFSWLNLYENVIDGKAVSPQRWLQLAMTGMRQEKEELITQLLLNELQSIYWVYLTPAQRTAESDRLEATLQQLQQQAAQPNLKKLFFKSWMRMALSAGARETIYRTWKHQEPPAGVKLSDDDYAELAAELAIRQHPDAAAILEEQAGRISNPDKKMRWAFLQPSLAQDQATRDKFFESLKLLDNRRKEAWVNTAVGYLHHPLRTDSAVKYIRPSLELLQEIQQTGDIFFPANFLAATLGVHQSAAAEKEVKDFLAAYPDYNPRLKNKLLQAADPLFRARKVQEQGAMQ